MKKIITKALLLLALSINIFHSQAQTIEEECKNSKASLTPSEAKFLQDLLKDVYPALDLKGKRILVMTGSSGKTPSCKTALFNEIQTPCATNTITVDALTDAEKREYRYDYIISYGSKVALSDRAKKAILKKSKKSKYGD
jgi:hypothetical protein